MTEDRGLTDRVKVVYIERKDWNWARVAQRRNALCESLGRLSRDSNERRFLMISAVFADSWIC